MARVRQCKHRVVFWKVVPGLCCRVYGEVSINAHHLRALRVRVEECAYHLHRGLIACREVQGESSMNGCCRLRALRVCVEECAYHLH